VPYGFALAAGAVSSVLVLSLAGPEAGRAADAPTIEVVPGGALEGVKGGKPLRVCADPDNLPFSSADLNETGFEVELAKTVADELGAAASFVWIPTGWGRRAISRLADGDCDVFPGLPVDPRFADQFPRLILSDPYYIHDHTVLVPEGKGIRSLADLQGKKIAVEGASIADYYAAKQGYQRHLYRRFHPEEAIKALTEGEADAVLMWSAPAGWAAKKNPGLRLRLIRVDDPQMRFAIGFAMRKKDSDLRETINSALKRIGPERVTAILGRYGVSSVPVALREGRATASGVADVVDVIAEDTPSESMAPDDKKPAQGAEQSGTVVGELGAGQIFGFCTPCHGLNARGGGIVPSLKDTKLTDSEFVKTVLNGRPGTPMRPYKGLLSERQILSVREHIRVKIPD